MKKLSPVNLRRGKGVNRVTSCLNKRYGYGFVQIGELGKVNWALGVKIGSFPNSFPREKSV